MTTRVRVFDTTLRDGEQSPGASMTQDTKVRFAQHLERLGVDVIEAGFPAASPREVQSVAAVAAAVTKPVVAALCRAHPRDIQTAWNAIEHAARPRLHTFLATSDIHLEKKLQITRSEALSRIASAVRLASQYTPDVEFSAEDASRSDPAFLGSAIDAAVQAGATTINLPDTVGYAHPREYAAMIERGVARCQDSGVVVSAHCHDDLGLAVANTLEAVSHGAGQVEVTVNGIGERAGNAALEEVVLALRTRKDHYAADTGVDATQVGPASRALQDATGLRVARNKAIVGANAFAHEAGIHQHGVLADARTYEIMSSASVGWVGESLVLGKHSGKHAVAQVLRSAGVAVGDAGLESATAWVKDEAEQGRAVTPEAVVAYAKSRG